MLDEKWGYAKEHRTHMKTKNKISKHLLKDNLRIHTRETWEVRGEKKT